MERIRQLRKAIHELERVETTPEDTAKILDLYTELSIAYYDYEVEHSDYLRS